MEQVVSTPESVDMIFAHMSRKENATTALVCKSWLEHSRDHIWCQVLYPKELSCLLVPLKKTPESDFVRIPQREDWQRFEPYSRRVRSITFGKDISMTSSMAFTLLRSQFRPNPVFPNLHSLYWSLPSQTPSNESVHILFLHPGVRSLTLYNISEDRINSEAYPSRTSFQDVVDIAPNLTQLDSRPLTPRADKFVGLINESVSYLPNLRQSAMAPPLFTTFTLQTLSRLPQLREILPVSRTRKWVHYDPENADGTLGPSVLEPGAFQSSRAIHLSMTIRSAINFSADEHFPAKQSLDSRVRVLDVVRNVEVQELLTTITALCVDLRTLTSILYPPQFALSLPPAGPIMNVQRGESLDAETIKPLRTASKLETSIIHHILAVSVNEQQSIQLSESLPHLKSFYFVPRPDYKPGSNRRPSPSHFNWHTLTTILRKFPRIRESGLYFDSSSQPPDDMSSISTSSYPQPQNDVPPSFERFDLHVGTTPPPSSSQASAVAYRLLALLDNDAALTWGTSAPSAWGAPQPTYLWPSIEPKLEDWKLIQQLLYFGFSARSGVYRAESKRN